MNRRETRQRRIKVFCVTALLGLPIFLAAVPGALAGDPRDIVFECPCSAEWVAGAYGKGTMELSFGVRSFRATESGAISVTYETYFVGPQYSYWISHGEITVGQITADEHAGGLVRVISEQAPRPSGDAPIHFNLLESFDTTSVPSHQRERLTLWPVPGADDADRIRYVDILTDTDGDGVGDVNERIAGTNPYDPASIPGESTVDILWLYDDGAPHGTQYTKAHHLKAVVNTIYVDSGTNIRFRTVGIRRIEKAEDSGWADREHVTQLMDHHGADISHQIGYSLIPCFGGCADLGGKDRGLWNYAPSSSISWAGPGIVAHELGHVMGLVHSARQGEAGGVFRWSRGHYLHRWAGRYSDSYNPFPTQAGTIMSYGAYIPNNRFSDPAADCIGEPCGVPSTEANGADARRSLDLLRFQVAAHRDSKTDSDGDGFVNDADAAPDDPKDWMDSDGDGLGDNADPDDDGDGFNDTEDRWPLDPLEWEDLDGDGVGDNADDAVEVQGSLDPFRDAALRRVVEQALGKSAGDSISAEEMAGLQRLSLRGGLGVRDLTGMELATGLTRLYIYEDDVTDLSPIAELTNLKILVLFNNPIADLSPVAGLTQLELLLVERTFVTDLSPLAGLTNLETLRLQSNQIIDLSPLAGLTNLKLLWLSRNQIVDLSPLSDLAELNDLQLSQNRISDVSFLSGLSGLQTLGLEQNVISNLAPLSGMQALRQLFLTANLISDLTPLQGLANLETLGLGQNRVKELSPLSDLMRLRDLRLDSNDVSDLSPLRDLELDDLDVGRTGVSLDDVTTLPRFPDGFHSLGLDGLGISDVTPLASLSRLRRLSLADNLITDVSALAVREIWSEDWSVLLLSGNLLDEDSVTEHVPLLESWGVTVNHERSPVVDMPDVRLRSLVAQETAGNHILVDVGALTKSRMEGLWFLDAFNAGVSDLTGLETAIELRRGNLGSNAVSDLP